MRSLYYVALLLGLCTSCATTETLPAGRYTPSRADSLLASAQLPHVGKLVIRGNVTVQAGTGNTNSVVGKDKTGQRTQAMSTGANSPVTASQKKGGLPWWVFALVAVGGAIGWEYVSHQLSPLGWLKWRAPVAT